MQRDLKKTLLSWKDHPFRMPLIIRGARQVGKTFLIEQFGREEFQNLFSINLELSPIYHSCFENLEPRAILKELELLARQKIVPGSTLLFLDEIQQCPKALQSLRYFKEKLPDLHIIAAGSLLEFAIKEEDFSFPVGRVQFAKLYPLSFSEFLTACGDSSLRSELSLFTSDQPPSAAIHQYCLEKIKDYFVVGGMPAVLNTFLKTHSFLEAKYVQKSLWDAFEADFGKYAKQTQYRYLKKIFEEGPKLIGSHVKYSRIDPDLPNPTREIKLALQLLRLAGLIHPITAVSAGTVPLLSGIRDNIFKLLFLDIGLLEQTMNVDSQHPGFMAGPLAEQFVGQEILAASNPLLDERLFFWSREKAGSSAEVDYVIEHQGNIFPIEVKAGKSGKLRSLQVFIKEKNSPFGIKISQEPLRWDHNILCIPFYMIPHIYRLIDTVKTVSRF